MLYQATKSQARASAELELRKRRRQKKKALITSDYKTRLPKLFPAYTKAKFAQRHHDLYEWENSIEADTAPERSACVAIWGRGGGKSTTAEMVAADLVVTERRRYIWYVCATQDSADIHLEAIRAMLESEEVEKANPSASNPKVTKIGTRQSWQRSRLVCANGCMVEAVGLDKNIRGRKHGDARPDFIILDDVDNEDDSPRTTNKKERAITTKILPSQASHGAILFVQNLIHSNSIASRLYDQSPTGAEYLADRIVLGAYPAVEGLKTEFVYDERLGKYIHKIVEGVATWEGQSIEDCQKFILDYGLTSFLTESQHEVNNESEHALLTREILDKTRVSSHPPLDAIVTAVDPHATVGQTGIITGGKALVNGEWHCYILEDASSEYGASPAQWSNDVASSYGKNKADYIVAEKNNGGEMVRQTLKTHPDLKHATIELVHASRGKKTRAQPVAGLWETGRVHLVGRFPELEKQWVTWEPGDESPNALDACVWLVTDLLIGANYAPSGVVANNDNSPSIAKTASNRLMTRAGRLHNR